MLHSPESRDGLDMPLQVAHNPSRLKVEYRDGSIEASHCEEVASKDAPGVEPRAERASLDRAVEVFGEALGERVWRRRSLGELG